MTDGPSPVLPCAESTLKFLDDEIEGGRIEIYRSLLGQPYIVFRSGEQTHRFHLYDQQVRERITDLVWREEICLIKKYELDRVLTALAGRAGNNHRGMDDPELISLLEAEPVLAVAIEFMEAKNMDRLEDTMDGLWKRWHAFAKERGLLRIGHRRFPAGSNVLGKKLRQLKTVLEQLGISVTIQRSCGSKITIVRQKDSSEYIPSVLPSDQNSAQGKHLINADDRKTLLARLYERRHQEPQ